MTNEVDQHDDECEEDEAEEIEDAVCSCPSVVDLARLGAEGLPIPVCPIHRPEPGQGSSTPLNSSALLEGIKRELRASGELRDDADLAATLRAGLYEREVVPPKPKPTPSKFPPIRPKPPEDKSGLAFHILRR